MKKKQEAKTYFFVDESGDPTFYNRHGNLIVDKEGCSKILILGFVKTEDPQPIRLALEELRGEIKKDSYLQPIPSITKSLKAFHATDDAPEVRERVYKTITKLKFKAEFIVARKLESVFIKRHKKNQNLFYDDLVVKLFQNQLHRARQNIIYFAVRGNRARQLPLENAIQMAILAFEDKWKTKVVTEIKVLPQRPEGEPCLQITDYMNWAVQRAFVRRETRYLDFVKEKVSLIVEIGRAHV